MNVPASGGGSLSGSESAVPVSRWSQFKKTYTPKSVVCLREGISAKGLMADFMAGITVGIIALPLSMALAIASGVTPERGLYTAVVAGFLIALFSGSRIQIGGPTGAFVVLVYEIVQQHGYEGLAIATLMAGVILIIMGLAKFGKLIKFIPYPVVTGFTSGIAVIIFSQQIKDFFGLQLENPPPHMIPKWIAYAQTATTFNAYTLGIGVVSLAIILLMRRWIPKVPGVIVAVIVSAVVVAWFHWDAAAVGVETIGTRFATPQIPSGIPASLPSPWLPPLNMATFEKARHLIPQATTLALLAAIESLLCCVVADGMTGGRHKSDCELVGQGIANIGSIMFGGIPATGAIARTAANIKSGGKTPLAGIIHALTILALMLLLAPYATQIPLATLAAILIYIAWNMAEIDHFRSLLRSPKSDIAVLLTTFGLTVFADLTVAVGVGVVLASLLFMRRMTEITSMASVTDFGFQEPEADTPDPDSITSWSHPSEVEVYEINGPFFFGVAEVLQDVLRSLARPPKVFILHLRHVPVIDATALHALEDFYKKCHHQGTTLLFAETHEQVMNTMRHYGMLDEIPKENFLATIPQSMLRAHEILS